MKQYQIDILNLYYFITILSSVNQNLLNLKIY